MVQSWALTVYGYGMAAYHGHPWELQRQRIWDEFRTGPLAGYQPYWPPGNVYDPAVRAFWRLLDGGWLNSWACVAQVAEFQCFDLSQVVPAVPLEGAGLSVLLSSWYQTVPPSGFGVRVAATTADDFIYGRDSVSVANALYAGEGLAKGTGLPIAQAGARLVLFPGLARRRYLIVGYFVDQALTTWRETNPLPLQWIPGGAGAWFECYPGLPRVRVMRL